MNTIKNNRGFTFTEILFALALVVGIMATFLTALQPRFEKGKISQAKIAIANLEQAVDFFYMDCNYYPSEAEGWEALISAPEKCESWGPEPYLKKGKVPKDPWGNEFIYNVQSNGKFEIISLGKGGKEGGEGYAKDISSKDL